MLRLLALTPLVAIGACSGGDALTPSPEVSTAFQLELGARTTIEQTDIRFDSVVDDSRCPEDVQCVWEGQASVRLVVGRDTLLLSVPNSTALRTGEPPVSGSASGLTLEVLTLTPYPGSAAAQAGATPTLSFDVARQPSPSR